MKTHKNATLFVTRSTEAAVSLFDKINDIIRKRAYDIFNNRGQDNGDALTDWLNAKSELLARTDFSLEEKDNKILIQGDISGFSPDEIEVKIKNGLINICGLQSWESIEKKTASSKKSAEKICFYQSYSLPENANIDKMEIKMKNGKLTVNIPLTRMALT
jgi:HSP20 family molecular chaperone IbpA